METPPPKKRLRSEFLTDGNCRLPLEEYNLEAFAGTVPEDVFDDLFNQIWSDTVKFIKSFYKQIRSELCEVADAGQAKKVAQELIRQVLPVFHTRLMRATDELQMAILEKFRLGAGEVLDDGKGTTDLKAAGVRALEDGFTRVKRVKLDALEDRLEREVIQRLLGCDRDEVDQVL